VSRYAGWLAAGVGVVALVALAVWVGVLSSQVGDLDRRLDRLQRDVARRPAATEVAALAKRMRKAEGRLALRRVHT
jgi:hypothetical protein